MFYLKKLPFDLNVTKKMKVLVYLCFGGLAIIIFSTSILIEFLNWCLYRIFFWFAQMKKDFESKQKTKSYEKLCFKIFGDNHSKLAEIGIVLLNIQIFA